MRNKSHNELAIASAVSIRDAQHLLVRAERLEVVPLKLPYSELGGDCFITVTDDGWVHEQFFDGMGKLRIEHRNPFPGGKPIRIIKWDGYQGVIDALQKVAKGKSIDLAHPVMPQPVDVLHMRFMNNGHLCALYRRRGDTAAHFGLVYVPRGVEGGGATISAAPWAFDVWPLVPPKRKRSTAATSTAPFGRVVDIALCARGTPRGHWIYHK